MVAKSYGFQGFNHPFGAGFRNQGPGTERPAVAGMVERHARLIWLCAIST